MTTTEPTPPLKRSALPEGTQHGCGGRFRQSGPGRYFVCDGCATTRHVALCVDSEGKVQCICGLADRSH